MDATWWRQREELDPEQLKIIQLDIDGKYVIVGPPGSGKTNILLLRATYIQSAGYENYLVLTYTRTLKDFISSGNTRINNKLIKTYASWATSFLKKRGVEILEDQKEESKVRNYLTTKVREHIDQAGNPEATYDAIFIDEIQDYSSDEIDIFSKLTTRLFLVGDEKQRIYEKRGAIEKAEEVGCAKYALSLHYRIGKKICEVADSLYPSKPDLQSGSHYNEATNPSQVKILRVEPFDAQLGILMDALKTQIKAFPGQWIGVFAFKRKTVDRIASFLREQGMDDKIKVLKDGEEDRAFESERPIYLSTIHGSKGCEFRCVHILDAHDWPHFSAEMAFMAVTRTKTSLTVYYSGTIEPKLLSALTEKKIPKLEF